MPVGLPILLSLERRRILIVGGGQVAARKAATLIAAGASDIRCLSPAFDPGMPASVVRIPGRYAAGVLADIDLVFAATDNAAVNAAVIADARDRRILASRADADPDAPGDFTAMAHFAAGPVVVAVSGGGGAVASGMRDAIRSALDPGWADLAAAMEAARPQFVATEPDAARRRAAFRAAATPAGFAAARAGAGSLLEFLRQNATPPKDA